jgi:cysteine-rich repeat protein
MKPAWIVPMLALLAMAGVAAATCGDGLPDVGEECDDGNVSDGDCCSSACLVDGAGMPCTDDGNPCTDDACDGAGQCTHPANTASCDDGVFCNGTDTCDAGLCTHTGDPCAGGAECAATCNEAADNCFDPAVTPCTDDGNVCTDDRCNGAGTCTHPAGHAGAICRAATGPCDAAETCNGVAPSCPADGLLPDGTPCNDGNPCTGNDRCHGSVCSGGPAITCPLCERCEDGTGCVVAPRASCKEPMAPGRTSLSLKNKIPNVIDTVTWNWTTGAATTLAELGDPETTDDYGFCIYTGAAATLTFKGTAPAGGLCGNLPCWKGTNTVIKYADKSRTPDGTLKVMLRPGAAGKARVRFDGKGDNLSDRPLGIPAPPLSLPVQVQLQSKNGSCFDATYSTPTRNGAGYFSARSD